jgi:hypothetical protein
VILVVYADETVEFIDADVISQDHACVTLLRGEVVISEPRLVVVCRLACAQVLDAIVV